MDRVCGFVLDEKGFCDCPWMVGTEGFKSNEIFTRGEEVCRSKEMFVKEASIRAIVLFFKFVSVMREFKLSESKVELDGRILPFSYLL